MVKGFDVHGTLYCKTIDASMNIPELQKPAMAQKLLELQRVVCVIMLLLRERANYSPLLTSLSAGYFCSRRVMQVLRVMCVT